MYNQQSEMGTNTSSVLLYITNTSLSNKSK